MAAVSPKTKNELQDQLDRTQNRLSELSNLLKQNPKYAFILENQIENLINMIKEKNKNAIIQTDSKFSFGQPSK